MIQYNEQHLILRFANDQNNISYDHKRRLKHITSAPTSSGRKCLLKHLDGNILTARQAIIAFCCECSGDYVDGRVDCENPLCPLYRFMPYGQLREIKTRRSKKKESENGNNQG